MKKLMLLLSLFCLICCIKTTQATEHQRIEPITLTQVKSDIKAKKDFYLFIGREDNVDAQLALSQLQEASLQTGQPIFFLDLKGIDSKTYKAFSKKYAIRSSAYLAHFAKGKQVAVYHNNWRQNPTSLHIFLKSID